MVELGPSVPLVLLAVVGALNPFRRAVQVTAGGVAQSGEAALSEETRRGEIVALGAGGGLAVGLGAALIWLASPVQRWMSVSPPTFRLGAAVVLVVVAVGRLLGRGAEAFGGGGGTWATGPAGVAVVAFPFLVSAEAGMALIAASVDAGRAWTLAGWTSAIAAFVLSGRALLQPSVHSARRRWTARAAARAVDVVAVFAGVLLAVAGVLDL